MKDILHLLNSIIKDIDNEPESNDGIVFNDIAYSRDDIQAMIDSISIRVVK